MRSVKLRDRFEDVRIETEGGPLAEDVDVALKLLTQRRREACEAKAMCGFYEKGSEMVRCI